MTDFSYPAEDAGKVRNIDRLVSLRASLLEAQNELRNSALQQTPTCARGFVEAEIKIAKLEQRVALLTEQYREALSAYVLSGEGDN